MRGKRALGAVVFFAAALVAAPAALAAPTADDFVQHKLAARHGLHQGGERRARASEVIARNFEVLGHEDLGLEDSNADVWVHGNFAYVGTALSPCSGRGVKIVDVSNLREPEMSGTLAGRAGTSAEDMVVRTVSTEFFKGDLLAVGIQGPCSEEADGEDFGLELWDVSSLAEGPPVKLGEIALAHGEGGVHELDLFQRGSHVYALVATPFSEFFDPVPGGDFRIVDVTNPRTPVQVGEWGANAHALTPGPFFGQGSFGAAAGHSARASADGMQAYVSYRDLGVLTLDISDVTEPTLLTRTRYPKDALDDGEAHSVSEYAGKRGHFLLQNDEDFDPRSPAQIRFPGGTGIGNESHHAAPLWLKPEHRVKARVVMADNQGCNPGDYPASTAGKIAVARFPFPFFDPGFVPGVSEEPFCFAQQQATAAAAAGAVAVVHDFVAESTSPQLLDFEEFGPVDIPALFTDHATAQGMVAAGKAELRAQKPSWGYLRVFDSATGKQVAKFDKAPNVGALPPPAGFWSIHNTEVAGDRAYSSWYTNGIVALNLRPLNDDDVENPKMVGQFVPTAGGVAAFPSVWGVAIRRTDNVIFASDEGSGLWIVRPTGKAAP
jgi:hypothetical protein